MEKDKNCARCNKPIGIRNHDAEESGGFDGKLCHSCYEIVREGVKVYDVTYYSGHSQLPIPVDGRLYIHLFDQANKVIFKPKRDDGFHIALGSADIKNSKIITKNQESLKKKVITAGLLRTSNNRYLQIDLLYGNKEETLILDCGKAIDEINTTVSLIINSDNGAS